MELTGAIQEALITLLCYDPDPRGAKMVRSLIEPKLFDVYYRDIAQAAHDYIDKYGKPPGEHTLDLFDVLKSRNEETAEFYSRIYQSMRATKKGVNRDYVVTHATAFARHQRLKRGITVAVDLLNNAKSVSAVDEAETEITKCLKGTHDLFDVGIRLGDPVRSLSFLEQQLESFPTGIPALDRYSLGPARKTLHVFAALQGMGKSWWLMHLAKMAMLNRKRVVHITLEMSQEKCAMRYLQSLFSITKRQAKELYYHTFKKDEKGKFLSLRQKTLSGRPSFTDEHIRRYLAPKLKALLRRSPIIIKEFPPGRLSPKELTGYLDSMEGAIGFIPDLLIVDYADLMKIDPKNRREGIGQTYIDLRATGVERNIAVASASQANRSAVGARWITRKHIAEDVSKISTADNILTYSQTHAEYELGLARLFQDKARDDTSQTRVLISQMYSTGQFVRDSVGMAGKNYWEAVKESVSEDMDMDDDSALD